LWSSGDHRSFRTALVKVWQVRESSSSAVLVERTKTCSSRSSGSISSRPVGGWHTGSCRGAWCGVARGSRVGASRLVGPDGARSDQSRAGPSVYPRPGRPWHIHAGVSGRRAAASTVIHRDVLAEAPERCLGAGRLGGSGEL